MSMKDNCCSFFQSAKSLTSSARQDCPESNPLILGIAPPTADLSQVGGLLTPGNIEGFEAHWFSLRFSFVLADAS